MKISSVAIALLMTIALRPAAAQGVRPAPLPNVESIGDQGPPSKAYADCWGKAEGDVVQHATPEGVVVAKCSESPEGLLARPEQRNEAAEPREPLPEPAISSITNTTGNMVLTSRAADSTGTLSAEYSCDGIGSSPALSWANAPLGSKEFAVMMTTLPPDGGTKWNWVIYGIPPTTTELARDSVGIGMQGAGSHGSIPGYEPPCSKGPGLKTYTVTVYALSAHPVLNATTGVSGDVLTRAISGITLDSGTLNLRYGRTRKQPPNGVDERNLEPKGL